MKLKLLVLACIISFVAQAQENLQSYTPSALFDKGGWEFKSFQNLYTQTKAFDGRGSKVSTGRGSETFFTSINQLLYGVNSKINIGADVWVKHVNLENPAFGSRTAVVGFGPKLKITPFKGVKRLSIQSTFLFPLADRLEGGRNDADPFLHPDGSLWLNQVFYDLPINNKWQLFFQQAFWYNLVRNSFRANNYLQTQTSAFVSFFPTSRWTLYGMTEYFPTHYNHQQQSGEVFFSYFLQSGIGSKYQLVPNVIELELLYTNFWKGSEGEGAGETVNLGIRVIRQ